VCVGRLPGAEHCLANAACHSTAQLVAPFVNIHFLGSSLTFMMVYVWGRRNEHVRMSFLGLFPFTAPYLPWVLFSFSILLGNSATTDLIGIIVGHMYYFLEGWCFALVLVNGSWCATELTRTALQMCTRPLPASEGGRRRGRSRRRGSCTSACCCHSTSPARFA